jgi:hypothetical protein
MPVITPATMAMMLQDATMQATKLVAVATSVLIYQDYTQCTIEGTHICHDRLPRHMHAPYPSM